MYATISVENECCYSLRHGSMWLSHRSVDPIGVNRLEASWGDVEIELLPSKALAVGQVRAGCTPLLWDPPLERLPVPAALDPRESLLINGTRSEGFGWIAGFAAGIEPLGLSNWGIPRRDASSGELLALHGEAALIPVSEIAVKETPEGVELCASLFIRDLRGQPGLPWYDRGTPLFRVDRRVVLRTGLAGVFLLDTITNLGDNPALPDWGYHVQLRPLDGAVYRVPSRDVHGRHGARLAADHEIWRPARRAGRREERGVVHRGLSITHLRHFEPL